MSVQMGHTLFEIVLMVGFGVFIWTLIEYTVHRFLFHIKTKTYWLAITFSFYLYSSIYLLYIRTLLKWCPNFAEIFVQGKHHALSSPWLPSQAPHGPLASCFPSCCSSYSNNTGMHLSIFLHVIICFLSLFLDCN